MSCAQNTGSRKLDLDFEQPKHDNTRSWSDFGGSGYKIYIDSTTAKHGKFSAVIENTGKGKDFKALAFTLPDNYKGKKIRLSGYIKTEKVTAGYAGLWMRIDPNIGFDNMKDRGITGTTDWKKYEITLQLNPKETDKIVLGGLLVGNGKMWLDKLEVSIDGKKLEDPKLKTYQRKKFPAEKDHEFDKGSTIVIPDLSPERIDNLALLGKIWGFLKYHHPNIAAGNYNWDYELFRILPDYLKADKQQRNKVLLNWINKYGTIPPCKTCKQTAADAVLQPDLSWIAKSDLSVEVKAALKKVYECRNQKDHYYISLRPGVKNPEFTHENAYQEMTYPDSGFRLLSLYRYWNMIEYFYPNKHLTDKDWGQILTEYIPKFIEAENELTYELAALQLIGEVHDTHANLWGGGDKLAEARGNNYAVCRAEFIEDKFVVVDYYNPELLEESKLKIGDIITHIQGKPINTLVDSLEAYYPHSNKAAMLRDISIDLLRSPKNQLSIQYISEGKAYQHKLPLYESDKLDMYHWYKVNKEEKSFKRINGDIGYISLANIKKEDIPEIKKSFRDTKGIIIDIRNYPSTFVPFRLGSYFVSKPTHFVKFTQGNIHNPGEFTFRKGTRIKSRGKTYKGKLVVLVNEKTQSQAEYTAMAFRAVEDAKIVGSTTAGADGNISPILLPGGLRTMISGIGVYYPDATPTQRVGIVPDRIITPTIEGIKKGKDEVLEKAIELINR